MQLALAIDVGRQFLRATEAGLPPRKAGAGLPPRKAGAERSPLQPFVSEIERMALETAGRKVARRFGLYVADAIDPGLIPAGPLWDRKWPALAPLMSPSYAARFQAPRT